MAGIKKMMGANPFKTSAKSMGAGGTTGPTAAASGGLATQKTKSGDGLSQFKSQLASGQVNFKPNQPALPHFASKSWTA